MKTCPYCAEEIQDRAVVCKHCGRDLKTGASQVQVVQVKQKTGPAAWGCLTLILLGVVGWCNTQLSPRTTTPTRSESTPTAAAPTLAPQSRQPTVKSGSFGKYRFTYQEEKGTGAFFFEPPLPADDSVVIDAIRTVLADAYKINMRNVKAPRIVDKFLRFVAAEGVYDCLVAKDNQNRVLAVSVIRRD